MNFEELSLDLYIIIEYLIVKLKVEFLIAMHLKSFAWNARHRIQAHVYNKISRHISWIESTLYFYNNEPSKNKCFPILVFSLARYLQEPRLKRIFEILWVLFEKILVFYSDWPRSLIWWTMGHARNIFFKMSFS